MADILLPFRALGQRHVSAWLIVPVLAGAGGLALLSGRQEVRSALPLLSVAGFYFALYRTSSLRPPAEEPAAGATSPVAASAAGPVTETQEKVPGRAVRAFKRVMAALQPKRRAGRVKADGLGRLATMAAAERRRERSSRVRTGT